MNSIVHCLWYSLCWCVKGVWSKINLIDSISSYLSECPFRQIICINRPRFRHKFAPVVVVITVDLTIVWRNHPVANLQGKAQWIIYMTRWWWQLPKSVLDPTVMKTKWDKVRWVSLQAYDSEGYFVESTWKPHQVFTKQRATGERDWNYDTAASVCISKSSNWDKNQWESAQT